MFYIVLEKYIPGTAPTNRILSYAKALSEQGIPATIVFLFPNQTGERVEISYKHIEFKYLWLNIFSFNKYLKWIVAKAYLRYFIMLLKKGDVVYLYNNSELIDLFTKIEGVKVYHERTEHPAAHEKIYTRFKRITIDYYYESCKRLDGLFVISTALKRLFLEKGIAENKIHILNITVDSERFEGLQKNDSQKYIAYCGTASNNKDGVDSLIRAFSIFSKQVSNYTLIIIGKTPSIADESKNLQLIKKLDLQDKIQFTGFVSPDKMPQILKNASILALDRPDNLQAKYGFPTKLGEYLLSQNPVIVTKVGEIPLFFENKVNAILVNPGDDKAFADGLLWLVNNQNEATMIGERGAEIANKQFNYYTVTKKIVEVIYKK